MRLTLVIMIACSAPHVPPVDPLVRWQHSGVPLSVWHPSEQCESWFWEPAMYCDHGRVHDFDGCLWHCIAAPIEGARQ